jgi:predicted alpha-1,6-mannanase (GH76 family)
MPPAARPHLRRPGARRVALAAAAVLAASACARGAAPTSSAAAGTRDAAALGARADAAIAGLLGRYWDGAAADFAGEWPSDGSAAGYWVSAIAVDALLDAAERTGDPAPLDAVRAFALAQDGRGWTRDWFDDEAWMAVALLHAYDVTRDASFLDRATGLVADIAQGAPDDSCCGTAPGLYPDLLRPAERGCGGCGLWWDRAHSQKATAANAVTAIAAARLSERTGDGRWLDLARRTYACWSAQMVDPATGQVADHVLPSGERVWWRFSYDGGAMIAAALALARATGDAAYVDDARRYAGFLVAAGTRPTAAGPVLFDGAGCSGDCDAFKGIAHRHLADLAAVAPDVPGLEALLEADAAALWSVARDPGSGLFGVDWGAPAGEPASLASQASAATALGVEAARAAAAR